MTDPTGVSNRVIGELFVERGLVSRDQLNEALSIQHETGGLIGEILVESFGVSRIELASVLAEQWSALESVADDETPSATPAVVVSAESEPSEPVGRRPLGEIFIERGAVTEEQIQEALRMQQGSGQRVGEILVGRGVIGRLELAGALAEQWAGIRKLRPPAPRGPVSWQEAALRRASDDPTSAQLERLRGELRALEARLSALEAGPADTVTRVEFAALAGDVGARMEELRRVVGGGESDGHAAPDADAPVSTARAEPRPTGYVALVSTPGGYLLRVFDGLVPAVDDLLEVAPGEPKLRVVRVTASPLVLDERRCVVLEPA